MRGTSLIVNLPGNPRAIGECLPLLLSAIIECLDHLGHPRLAILQAE
jgi:molybdopterin adenylyltransferase